MKVACFQNDYDYDGHGLVHATFLVPSKEDVGSLERKYSKWQDEEQKRIGKWPSVKFEEWMAQNYKQIDFINVEV